MAKSIREQYLEIRAELDLNQQEHKKNQDKLLERIHKLQDDCPHDDTEFNASLTDTYVRCKDCFKIMTNNWGCKPEMSP